MKKQILQPGQINPWVRRLSFLWLKLRKPFVAERARRLVLESIQGVPFLVFPEVLNPVLFRGGALLAKTVASSPFAAPPEGIQEPRALDMGTGSGAAAVFAARRGFSVVAVDLNSQAVRCAQVNALINRLEDCIEVRHGDLFEPVRGEQFDLLLFNPPFYKGAPRDDEFDLAWRGEDVLERFAQGLPEVLKPRGRALLLLSTEGDGQILLQALQGQRLAIQVLERRHFGNEVMTVYGVERRRSRL
ncbi:MAG: HemK2/MTQ2 family protein methyltransferase [Acidobacteriota bacterium]